MMKFYWYDLQINDIRSHYCLDSEDDLEVWRHGFRKYPSLDEMMAARRGLKKGAGGTIGSVRRRSDTRSSKDRIEWVWSRGTKRRPGVYPSLDERTFGSPEEAKFAFEKFFVEAGT